MKTVLGDITLLKNNYSKAIFALGGEYIQFCKIK